MSDAYIRAGYLAQCGCRKNEALSYVGFVCMMEARWGADNCKIEINAGDSENPMWIESGYAWENDTIYRRIA